MMITLGSQFKMANLLMKLIGRGGDLNSPINGVLNIPGKDPEKVAKEGEIRSPTFKDVAEFLKDSRGVDIFDPRFSVGGKGVLYKLGCSVTDAKTHQKLGVVDVFEIKKE